MRVYQEKNVDSQGSGMGKASLPLRTKSEAGTKLHNTHEADER